MNFSDEEISSNRYENRIKNHQSSEKSKASGALPAKEAEVVIGDIVHVKNEGTKPKAREFYLVVAVDHEQSKHSKVLRKHVTTETIYGKIE